MLKPVSMIFGDDDKHSMTVSLSVESIVFSVSPLLDKSNFSRLDALIKGSSLSVVAGGGRPLKQVWQVSVSTKLLCCCEYCNMNGCHNSEEEEGVTSG